MTKERPIELEIVILLFAIFGILTIVLSAYYLTDTESLADYNFLSYIVLLVGVIELVAVYGLYKKLYWAWNIAIMDCLVGIAISIVFILISNSGAVGIISSGICLFLLLRPNVRKYFKK